MEVYGEKPKKFTKDWWGYIWDYYKWHIVSVVLAVFIVVTTLQQCANRPEYDLQITFVTEQGLASPQIEKIEECAGEVISDATENGEKEVYVTPIQLNDEEFSENMQAQYTKLMIEMSIPESYVFVMTRKGADMAIKNQILESTDVWAEGMESDGYVISLKDNEKIKEFGIDSSLEELYLGVVTLLDDKKEDALEVARYENGVRFGRYLLGLE